MSENLELLTFLFKSPGTSDDLRIAWNTFLTLILEDADYEDTLSDSALDSQEMFHLWSLRLEIMQSKNIPIHGCPDSLGNLNSSEKVIIQSVLSSKWHALIFTDVSIKKVLAFFYIKSDGALLRNNRLVRESMKPK